MDCGGHALIALLPKKAPYFSLHRRVTRSCSLTGCAQKISNPRTFEPQTFQPVERRITEWAISALVTPCSLVSMRRCLQRNISVLPYSFYVRIQSDIIRNIDRKISLIFSLRQLNHLTTWNVINPTVLDKEKLDGAGYKHVVELLEFVWWI